MSDFDTKVAFWNAVNEYAAACGGDTGTGTATATDRRQRAVSNIESLLLLVQPRCDGNSAVVWAIVELMGHIKLAGRVTEEEKFGAKMGRIDMPLGAGYVSQWFGGGSVYRITIVTEAVARDVARRNQPAPVEAWDYPKQLTNTIAAEREFDYDDDRR